MTLIQSISGSRGTIGGSQGDNLTPPDIVRMAAAYGSFIKKRHPVKPVVVIGRDARISGVMVTQLLIATLNGLGIDVVDIGLSTTPTVEFAVAELAACGGVVVTASHNPRQWNALKFLDEHGEFLNAEAGAELLQTRTEDIQYASIEDMGMYYSDTSWIEKHIEAILALPDVDVEAIKAAQFKIALDPVNSSGALAVPPLLEALGCSIEMINGEPNGDFAHNPEPLPENLTALSKLVLATKAHLGVAVDPDVDRVAFICEDGQPFGEEYTLVAVADYLLGNHGAAPTVSNLSSTRALQVVTEKHGGTYHAAAVGEVNVVTKMKEVGALIGGEGNGGVIYPALHYGRDALVGIAFFLSHLAQSGKRATELLNTYPAFHMSKNKAELSSEYDMDAVFAAISLKYKQDQQTTIDGLKITFDSGEWIHMRKSNTEPIIRIYTESHSPVFADRLAQKMLQDIGEAVKAQIMNHKS